MAGFASAFRRFSNRLAVFLCIRFFDTAFASADCGDTIQDLSMVCLDLFACEILERNALIALRVVDF